MRELQPTPANTTRKSFKKKPKEEAPKKETKPEEKKPGLGSKMKDKLVNYRRVIEVAKKPDKEERIGPARRGVEGMGMARTGRERWGKEREGKAHIASIGRYARRWRLGRAEQWLGSSTCLTNRS